MRATPFITIFVFLVLFVINCTEDSSNPTGSSTDNDELAIVVDSSGTSIFKNDTLHYDSGTVTFIGKEDKSRFQVKIDDKSWTEWKSVRSFDFRHMKDGKHVLHIRTRLSGSDDYIQDSLEFHVKVEGYRPEFDNSEDTSFSVKIDTDAEMAVEATGADSIYYQWYKDNSIIRFASEKRLVLEEVTKRDIGEYQCIAFNRYGSDTSRVISLNVLLAQGSITGSIADSEDSTECDDVKVILFSDNTDSIAESSGEFQFSDLDKGTYRLHITSSRYRDRTIDDVEVGDTGVTAMETIYLTKRDDEDIPWHLEYDGNGNHDGNAPVDSEEHFTGDTVIVAGNSDTLVKVEHYFNGWNTKSDGSGTSYNEGDTLIFETGDIVLYAVWIEISVYTVTYHAPGTGSGKVPVDKRKYEKDAVVVVQNNSGKLKKTGYSFASWNSAKDGSGTTYAPGATLTIDSTVHLYAQWSMNHYTLHYDENGSQSGTCPADSAYTYGDSAVVQSCGDLVKNGYTFIAWSTTADGNGVTVLEGKKLKIKAEDITLFAQWKVNEYLVTYDGNGNTHGSAPDTITVKFGHSVTIAGKGNLRKTGYNFDGWNTVAGGEGVAYPADTSFTIGLDNIKLYAQWEIRKFRIHFDTRGGNSVNDTLVNYDDTVPKPDNPVKTGYTFAGWYKESACTTPWNFSADKITANDTLYAKWENPFGMLLLSSGNTTYQMGTVLYDEGPEHDVRFTDDFWMDTTEVTQGQFDAIMSTAYGDEYSSPNWTSNIGLGDNYPAYLVNWYDAALYCNARTKATGSNDTFYVYTSRLGNVGDSSVLVSLSFNQNAGGFRLPTEALWEYAGRAGTNTSYSWGKEWISYPANEADSNEIDSYAVWWRNSENKGNGNNGYGTHQVGHKVKNPFDLYDMSGNIAEWCNDWYGDYGSNTLKVDPQGPTNGSRRIIRGGSWRTTERFIRSAARDHNEPYDRDDETGFRTCLPEDD